MDISNTTGPKGKSQAENKGMWSRVERKPTTSHIAWDLSLEGDPMMNMLQKVNNFQTHLKSWNKNVSGNIRIALARKRKLLAKAKTEAISGQGIGQFKILKEEINKLLDSEESLWSQKAKMD